MENYFAAIPLNNATVLCVGEITRGEATEARDGGNDIDGLGYYLFLARADAPSEPVELLAKFFSSEKAERAIRLMAVHPAALAT